MKKALKVDTLAYQLGARPLVIPQYMGGVMVPKVIEALNSFMEKKNVDDALATGWQEPIMGHPETDALVFYVMNHAVSVVRQRVHQYQPLNEYYDLINEYHRQLAVRSTRMFFYLLLICTRESRHEKTDYSLPLWITLEQKYGSEVIKFHKTIKGKSSVGAAERLRTSPPNVELGTYVKFLCEVFYQGSYAGGYGGPAWGAVADCLKSYVLGEYSAEMMMDTAFTLAHNNGPIFNKGMLFDSYTSDIYKILDVQRSGQIPQLIASLDVNKANHQTVQTLYQFCRSVIGSEFDGYVDWFQVESLGALKSYKSEQNQQVAKHGYPANLKAKQEAEAAKKAAQAKKKAEQDAKAAAEKAKNFLEVMPNVLVKKVEAERE